MKKHILPLLTLCVALFYTTGCASNDIEYGDSGRVSISEADIFVSPEESVSFVSTDSTIVRANIEGELCLKDISPTGFSQNIIFLKRETILMVAE